MPKTRRGNARKRLEQSRIDALFRLMMADAKNAVVEYFFDKDHRQRRLKDLKPTLKIKLSQKGYAWYFKGFK